MTGQTFGLKRLQNLIAGDDGGPMLKTMQQRVVSAVAGEVVVEGTPGVQFNNYMGRIHGGYLAALIDTAMGCAVGSKADEGTGFGTVDLSVKYVRKFEVATGPVYATARVLHAGRSMFTVECKVADTAGLLYAHGLGTFLVYPK
jgi:acyl-CoA thioesterase